MIVDHIDRLHYYTGLFPLLEIVAAFIRENPNPEGNIISISDECRGIIISTIQNSEFDGILEAHKAWIDVHFTLEGIDKIVTKPAIDCVNIIRDYNEQDDYILYKEAPVTSLEIPYGYFCLIEPNESHMAALGQGLLKKVVFKLKVSTIN